MLASGGEVSRYCPALLNGKIDKIVQFYIENLCLVPENFDAGGLIEACCHNCAWGIGEIALAYPKDFANYSTQIVNRICELFTSDNIKVNKKERCYLLKC